MSPIRPIRPNLTFPTDHHSHVCTQSPHHPTTNMDATQGPGVTIVKDEKGQYLVYVAMDGIGYASAVQDVGPRFQ